MTDNDAFLRTIIDNPRDDAPRLVYADWLEEHGDEMSVARAEFIRVQCQLARIPNFSLICRESELSNLLGFGHSPIDKRWYPQFSKSDYDYYRCDIRRGFVESIRATFDQWNENAVALRAAAPLLEVKLTYFRWGSYQDQYGKEHICIDAEGAKQFLEARWPGIEFPFDACYFLRE